MIFACMQHLFIEAFLLWSWLTQHPGLTGSPRATQGGGSSKPFVDISRFEAY